MRATNATYAAVRTDKVGPSSQRNRISLSAAGLAETVTEAKKYAYILNRT